MSSKRPRKQDHRYDFGPNPKYLYYGGKASIQFVLCSRLHGMTPEEYLEGLHSRGELKGKAAEYVDNYLKEKEDGRTM